eukprot:SAG31_NODE_33009_length_349_cov_0.620000_1_plen_55_part_10
MQVWVQLEPSHAGVPKYPRLHSHDPKPHEFGGQGIARLTMQCGWFAPPTTLTEVI